MERQSELRLRDKHDGEPRRVSGKRFLIASAIWVVLTFVTSFDANAQKKGDQPTVPLSEVEARLTGGGTRTWVYEEEIVSMGGSDDCDQGDVLRFSSDHSVTEEVCQQNKLKKTKLKWEIENEAPLDVAITIGDQKYLVLFKPDGKGW